MTLAILNPSGAVASSTSPAVNISNIAWCRIVLPIPASYAPNPNDPSTWWWSLQYSSAVGTQSVDTFAAVVTFSGNPAHLVSG